MSVDLKLVSGTVNWTGWLHITASKVATPGVVDKQIWIDAPLANTNIVLEGLDPVNYYIRFYHAPDNVSLGTLEAEALVNALTNEYEYEKRWYTVGGGNIFDPAVGDTKVTDPYLIDKNVVDVFKEGFRFLKPDEEYEVDQVLGEVDTDNLGVPFSLGEKISIGIKYKVGNNAGASVGGLYSGQLTVNTNVRTMLAAEKNARIRLLGVTTVQVITLPLLSEISEEDGYYFDNSVGGTAYQTTILTGGTDKILFNGFNTASNLFNEFWISKGEKLLLRKVISDAGPFWEVITEYKGVGVGEKVSLTYKDHPGIIPEAGQLIDGDEIPRLWWWITNVLPLTHKYFDAAITGAWSFDSSKRGQFAIHPTLKKFRMPATMNTTEKGLNNFLFYGADILNRPVDYPGGFQAQMVGPHAHPFKRGRGGGITGDVGGGAVVHQPLNPITESGWVLSDPFAIENRVANIGVIFGRRI